MNSLSPSLRVCVCMCHHLQVSEPHLLFEGGTQRESETGGVRQGGMSRGAGFSALARPR